MNFFNLFGGHGAHMEDDEDDPRRGFGGGRPEKKDVDTQQLYDFLGVAKDATDAQIKKAYFEKARIHHPDKGGDPEQFKKIQLAKEVLSDAQKRKIYDREGLEGLQGGGGGGGDMFDIFDLLNGGGRRQQQQQGPRKHKGVKKEFKITLENSYNGDLVHIPHRREKVCETCDGQGGQNVQTCGPCKGRGMIEKMIMLGPGMYQQVRQHCPECQGEGKTCKEKDRCKTCKGQKVVEQKKDLEVAIEKGVPNQHVILLHGEGDEAPGLMAGDVHLVIIIKEHPIFTRQGADLFMKKKISLLEALTGFYFTIEHLDGSKLTISTAPGEIVADGSKKTIKNKGMPFFHDQMSHGNLIIEFEVEFPKRNELKNEHIENLKKILPGPKQAPLDKEAKYFMLEDFDPTETNPSEEGGKKAEEEDEEGNGGTRVQCGQQ